MTQRSRRSSSSGAHFRTLIMVILMPESRSSQAGWLNEQPLRNLSGALSAPYRCAHGSTKFRASRVYFHPSCNRDHQTLGGSVFHICLGCEPCAMGTAEETATDLYAVTNNPTVAVLANGRNGLNRAFEAVECMPFSGCD